MTRENQKSELFNTVWDIVNEVRWNTYW